MAHADVGNMFGFGSRVAGLAGATVSGAFDAFATYVNPAGLPHSAGENRLAFSWGILGMNPEFTPIQSIVTTNDYTLDTVRTGDADLDYRATLGQVFGLSYRLEGEHRVTFGVAGFLPLNHLAFVDTGDGFAPEYFLYRARTQRPQVEMGVGVDLGRGLSAGAGLHTGFGMTTHASVLLEPGSSNTSPSSMRFSASIKPKASPTIGVLYAREGGFSSGLVARLPLESRHEMTLNAAANIITPLDFKFSGASALAYDPAAIEWGFSIPMTENSTFFFQGDYQFWRNFEAPVIVLTDIPGEGMVISPSSNPSFDYRNILTAKAGSEIHLGGTIVRLGYAYRPGILKDPVTEAGNYIDPSKHVLQAGLGFRFMRFLHLPTDWRLDLHLAYHRFVNAHVTKTPGNEVGDPAEPKIGSPGYDIGGKILGGGVSLSLAL